MRNSLSGQQAELPVTPYGMVSRIAPVASVAQTGVISGVSVYRSPFVPAVNSNGITLTAVSPTLPATLGASLTHGAFLNPATARYPAVVLGAEAATLLGITSVARPTQIWIGGRWFTVVGILGHIPLQTPMDAMAFIGFPAAEQYFGFDGHPTELYPRSDFSQVNGVADV